MNEPLGRFGSFRPARVRRIEREKGGDGRLLTDHPLVELVFHPQELRGLLLGEAIDRDARPVGEHLRDDLLVDDVEQVDALGAPLGFHGLLAVEAILLLFGELLRLIEGLLLDRGLLVRPQPEDLLFELLVRRGRGHPPDPQPAPRLVDEVDRLVRQVAVGEVAVGQVRRRDQRLVGDGDRVVRLVPVAQTLQDLDGQCDVRLLDLDRLEPAFERSVLLEVLAVLVDGGGPDGLQLAAGQHRLQDRGGVDRALGRARTDQGVELVDEQHDVAAGANLLQDLLEALLEIAAVAASCHQRTEVEGVQLLTGERLGDVVGHDALCESLDDGRLADAGLADQHRVVLRPAGEHLHHPLDLFLASDDRIELVIARERGEVPPELVEHR